MIINIFKKFKTEFSKEVDAIGLSIFRIIYSIILLAEVSQLLFFKNLIFDNIPFIEKAEINFSIPIIIWMICIIMVLFGIYTRFFAVLNYLLSLFLIGSISSFEYHVFYAYMGINFLIIFIPISKVMSIDRLLEKIKYTTTTFQYIPKRTISKFYYFILPFAGLAIVYLDSVFYKVVTPMWYNGLGSWLPSSLPMMTHVKDQWLLNQEILVKIVGWATILFETLFIYIFFKKRFRCLVVIFGLILHLGILFEFPIPWFALTACSLYVLIVPISFWKKIVQFSSAKHKKLTVFYDSECPLCVRTKVSVEHFDTTGKIDFKTVQFDSKNEASLSKYHYDDLLSDLYSVDSKGNVYKGLNTYIRIFSTIWYFKPISFFVRLPVINFICHKIYQFVAANRTLERCTDDNCGYNPPVIQNPDNIKILHNLRLYDLKIFFWFSLMIFISFTQTISITRAWSFEKLSNHLNINGTLVNNLYRYSTNKYLNFTKTFFGLTQHQVFTDRIHFDDYNHILSIYYQNPNTKKLERLPIIDENGMPDYYIYGANWVNWTFRVNGRNINQKKLKNGLKRYSAFYMGKNKIDFYNKSKFIIKVKKIDTPNGWEKDFLVKQLNKPWLDAGTFYWYEGQFFHSNIKNIESL